MAVTTTESLSILKVRCEACGREAKGGVCVGRADGRLVALCCAGRRDRELLESMVPVDAPEPEEDFGFVAHDPFDTRSGTRRLGPSGPTRAAAQVIAAVRRRATAAGPAESERYRQLTPELVKEALAERLPEVKGYAPSAPPSVPPPPGEFDLVLAGVPRVPGYSLGPAKRNGR